MKCKASRSLSGTGTSCLKTRVPEICKICNRIRRFRKKSPQPTNQKDKEQSDAKKTTRNAGVKRDVTVRPRLRVGTEQWYANKCKPEFTGLHRPGYRPA